MFIGLTTPCAGNLTYKLAKRGLNSPAHRFTNLFKNQVRTFYRQKTDVEKKLIVEFAQMKKSNERVVLKKNTEIAFLKAQINFLSVEIIGLKNELTDSKADAKEIMRQREIALYDLPCDYGLPKTEKE
jgi:hypothetical protein